MTTTSPPTPPLRRSPVRRRARRVGTHTLIALVMIVGVAVVGIRILTLHSTAASTSRHFVRTFSDPNGYAQSVGGNDGSDAAPAAAPSQVVQHAQVAGRRILTMKGGWTSDIGDSVARRALKWVGTPYSFAGGNATGPTLGTPVDEDSRNDGHIVGFDCSGLVIYALAPWMSLTHYAATQYVEAGAVHPTLDQLLPGDLVFWSSDGTIKGVGHVAVYVGHGNVVQAPESGDKVRVTPLDKVEPGAIGTTRPLTRL